MAASSRTSLSRLTSEYPCLINHYPWYHHTSTNHYKFVFNFQYAAWNPDNKKLYTQVHVKVRSQTHLENIVELIRSDSSGDDCNFIEKRMLETQMYQENFEVYIQTLISHALDPNFLTEIFQEQGTYCIYSQ